MPCGHQTEVRAPWMHHVPPETTYRPVLNLELKRNELDTPPKLQICLRSIEITVSIGKVSIDSRRVQRDSGGVVAALEG
jgi:hypothetical protein